jgi:energy-coupling factor transporter transmembrane protein EcfT
MVDYGRLRKREPTQWLVRIVVLLGAVVNGIVGALSLVAPQAFLASVGHPNEPLTAGAQTYAAYTGTRDLAVALVLVILLAARSTRLLAGVVLLVALTNALDLLDALASQRWPQVPGAFVFALAFGLITVWLLRQSDPANVV